MTPKRVFAALISLWIGLFGLTVLVAGFLRSASFSRLTTVMEIGIAVIGLLIAYGGGKALSRAITAKGALITARKQHVLVAAVLATALLFVLRTDVGRLPLFLSFLVTAGYQFGDFLLTVAQSVFSGRFGLDNLMKIFDPVPWFFQALYFYQLFFWVRKHLPKR